MERTINKTGLITLLLFSFFIQNQKEIHSQEVCPLYTAYISGDMQLWKTSMLQMEKKYSEEDNAEQLYKTVMAQYGYIAYAIGVEKSEEAKTVLKRALQNLDKLEKLNYHASELHALRGALLAFKIALNPYLAPVVGPNAENNIKLAVKLNPKNPTAWVETGNMKYHLPAILGGSYDAAQDAYSKAVSHFEANNAKKCNWLYLNSLAWLGKSYETDGKLHEAKLVYQKALEIEPDFTWVKNDLYPGLLRKM